MRFIIPKRKKKKMIFFFNFWLGISGRRAFKCGNVGFKGLSSSLLFALTKPIKNLKRLFTASCKFLVDRNYSTIFNISNVQLQTLRTVLS